MKKKILAGALAFVLTVGSISLPGVSIVTVSAAAKNEIPVLSGVTSIQIPVGSTFDKEDILNRVFAMDQEDGDLTKEIKVVSENVNTAAPGNYSVEYQVSDSKGASATLNTAVEVVSALPSDGQKIQKTLYTKGDAYYLTSAGTNRGYYHDRQNLGIYLNSGAVLKIRIVNASQFNQALTLDLMTDDSGVDGKMEKTEQSFTIPSDGSVLTVTAGAVLDENGTATGEFLYNYSKENNISKKTDVLADSVPFIRTPQSTIKPVIEYYYSQSGGMEELTYYHYGDSQTVFLDTWDKNTQDYAVVEGEKEIFLIPRRDRNNLFSSGGRTEYQFKTLDKLIEYYEEFQEQYDRFLGVSYDSESQIDKNVRGKYFVKGDLHGIGAAYYSGGLYTAQTDNSITGFLGKDWMNLHEFAHGYEGGLAYGDMQLVEVFNNIMAHYYERTFLASGDYGWSSLQNLGVAESKYIADREKKINFSDREYDARLYVFVNLLNKIGAEKAMAFLHHAWREYRTTPGAETISTTDFIVENLSNYSGYNLVPYFEKCGATVTDSAKARIYVKDYPILDYLGDHFSSQTASKDAMEALDTEGMYSLVDNKELASLNKTGGLHITIAIDDLAQIQGKSVRIVDGKTEVAAKRITGKEVSFDSLPIGSYTIKLPAANDASYYRSSQSVCLCDDKTAEVSAEYIKQDTATLKDDAELRLMGLGDWVFACVKTNIDAGKVIVQTMPGKPHSYIDEKTYGYYAVIEVLDPDGQQIFQKSYAGDQNYEEETEEISVGVGSRIRIKHFEFSNRLKVYSRNFNELIYNKLTEEDKDNKNESNILEFIVTENGLSRAGWTEQQLKAAHKEVYSEYAKKLDEMMTEEEKNDAGAYSKEKALLVMAVRTLNEEDQAAFKQLYPYLFAETETKNIADCTVTLEKDSFSYTGKAIEPAVTVTDGDIVLEKNADYKVEYSDNVDVGTAAVTVTGIHLYTGTVTKNFRILEEGTVQKKAISDCVITLEKESFVCTGEPIEPKVTIKDQEKTLAEGTDYSVEYSDNVNVGTGTATVTGMGDYTGSVKKTFTIQKEGEVMPHNPYQDVNEKDWYYKYIQDVYEKELMTGLNSTTFGPTNNLVRAQFAVILYRMEGSPERTYEKKFPDVLEGEFYTSAVLWASDRGIVTGYSDTKMFGPSDNITREQMAVMLYRYAEGKGFDVKNRKDLSEFPDAGMVSGYAKDAMEWCVAEQIITGDGGKLNPQGTTNRAVCATIISRFSDNYK